VGRIGSGVAELIAAILILIPPTTWLGAGLALAVMVGAIFSHLTVLGVVVMDDGGLPFGLALAVAACSVCACYRFRCAFVDRRDFHNCEASWFAGPDFVLFFPEQNRGDCLDCTFDQRGALSLKEILSHTSLTSGAGVHWEFWPPWLFYIPVGDSISR
jgi:hypothetical protein